MCQYPLFETIAIINGNIQNISYHQQRLAYSFEYYFQQPCCFDLSKIIIVPEIYRQQIIRCRIDYNSYQYNIAFYPYERKKVDYFNCVFTEKLEYDFKYTNRKILENLRCNSIKKPLGEIIIINNGFISDCSIGNLLFLRKEKWYSSNHFLLKGTQLSYLLDQEKVILTDIHHSQLFQYEKIMMINALNPFDLTRAITISDTSVHYQFK